MAQDDYYYEIQLTNKQLVFYFLAGATALILSFLAGIWVGRGVDARATETRVAREEPVVPVSDDPLAKKSPVPAEGYSYPQRLEADRPPDALETPELRPVRGTAGRAATTPTPATSATPALTATSKPTPQPTGAPAVKGTASTTPKPLATPKPTASPKPTATSKPSATVSPTPTPKGAEVAARPTPTPKGGGQRPVAATPAGGTLVIQVGAFRERERAEGVVGQLKKKGYPARVAAPAGEKGGLFNVTVGPYKARAEAERVMTRLAQQERFKPFLVHQ